MADNTTTLDVSKPLEHLSNLFCFSGAPKNLDTEREIKMIVNHGYAVGYSPSRLQPAWAAYRVSAAERDVDYERPHLFYEDTRLPKKWQIGTWGYGKYKKQAYDRGHLVPNYAINTQFGRLAQMETFFMSNIGPQRDKMNRGCWQKLEKLIIREFAPAWEHIWVLTGPIFYKRARYLKRKNGLKVEIPKSYFAILIDPIKYPHDEPKNVRFLALEIPQTAGYEPPSKKHITTIKDIESKTNLEFFPKLTAAKKNTVYERTSEKMWQTRNLAVEG